MTWASVSLRKMELKNRINNMESQLMSISEQLQRISSESSAKETSLSLWNNYNLSQINNEYMNNMQLAKNINWNAISSINSCTSIDQLNEYIAQYNEVAENDLPDDLLAKYQEEPTDEQLAEAKALLLSSIPETSSFTENASLGETDGTVFGNVSIDTNYYSAQAASTIRYNEEKMALEAQTSAESDTLKSNTDAEAQTLEAQQEALQTQLKTARAEYDSLGEALDNDISKGAIKLV